MNPAVDMTTTALIVGIDTADRNGDRDLPAPISLQLRYFREDPHAVRITIGVAKEWVVSRDTLRDGLALAVSAGRFGVLPVGTDIHLRLQGRNDDNEWCTCTLEIARDILQAFISRSYQLVPSGAESAHIDWDAELAALLGGAR